MAAGRCNLHVTKLLTKKLSLWVRLLPILFFFTYLNFTVFLFAYGPWPWPIEDGTKLYAFLVFAHLALLFGYLSAAFGKPCGYYGKWKAERIVVLSLIVNLVLLVPTSAFRTGRGIPDVRGGLANLGSVYYAYNAWRAKGGGLAEYARILLSPLLFLLFPLTIFYWQRLRWIIKGLSVLSSLYFLAIFVAVGTNKAVADYVLLMPFIIAASHFAGSQRLNWRRIVIVIVLGIVCFSLFMSFFTSGQISRLGSMESVSYFPFLGIFADSNNFLIRYLPPDVKVGAISLSSYLTQGYYALYLSLEEPFVPTWGVGNSMFLYFNATELTGIQEIQDMPYPVRVQRHGRWDAYGHWSTIYPWIASDASFPGTIVVIFLIGRVFALSWLDTLKGSNPFAIAAFAQFVIMLFYFAANNQVLQTGEALTAFCGVLALWLFTRRKYVWRKR
jgi:hypothetical protein